MNFQAILNQYYQPMIFSFVLTVILSLIALKIFPKLKLMDKPQKYGLRRIPIPYYGGLLIFLVFVVSVLIFLPATKALTGLLIGASIVMIVGFFDDMFNLSPFIRLFAQFAAALVLVFFGIGIFSINLPFIGVLDFSSIVWNGVLILSAIFTIVWVMTILNVMNFIDGVSGLSSGVSFIAGMTIFALSIHPGLHADPASQVPVATIALILAVVSLGFLIFDFPKPKILMGDTGSTFFGFVIAVLAIFSGGKVATAFLVLGIPILDMIWVVLRRLFSGQKFWKGDLKHLHHRLLAIGFSEKQVVIMYYVVTAFFGSTAVIFVSSQQKLFMLIALIVLMLILAGALVFIPNKK